MDFRSNQITGTEKGDGRQETGDKRQKSDADVDEPRSGELHLTVGKRDSAEPTGKVGMLFTHRKAIA